MLISSFFFVALHLNQAWATLGIVTIVFGAGLMLGILAWSSGSLLPVIIGHFMMDVGLFAFWWTGIAGNFITRPISKTGALEVTMTSPDSRQNLPIVPEIQATGFRRSSLLKQRRPRQYAWTVVVDCGYSNEAIALPRLPEHFHKCSQAATTGWRYPLNGFFG